MSDVVLASLLIDGTFRMTCAQWLSEDGVDEDGVDGNGICKDGIWVVTRVDGKERGIRHYMRLCGSNGLAEAVYFDDALALEQPLQATDLAVLTRLPPDPHDTERPRIDVIRLSRAADGDRREAEKVPDCVRGILRGQVVTVHKRGASR